MFDLLGLVKDNPELKDFFDNSDEIVQVYVGDGEKSRSCIFNINHAIINDDNILLITKSTVFEVTVVDNKFNVTHSKVGEKYNEFGVKIEDNV